MTVEQDKFSEAPSPRVIPSLLYPVSLIAPSYEPRAFVVRRIVCLDLDVDVYCRRRPSNSSFHTGASQRRALHGKLYLRDTLTNVARRRTQRTF